MNIKIRKEDKRDYARIKQINDLAFGQENEGLLVEKLRGNPKFIENLSLVAEVNDNIVGHILFFPVKIKGSGQEYETLLLAPMAVIPDFQRKGIGSQLIKTGLRVAQELGYKSVIVLGHKDYYPQFGFEPASKWKIKAPFEVPDEIFMAIELVEDGLNGISGIVEYPKEYDGVC